MWSVSFIRFKTIVRSLINYKLIPGVSSLQSTRIDYALDAGRNKRAKLITAIAISDTEISPY